MHQSRTLYADDSQSPMIRMRLIATVFEKLNKDVVSHKDFYIKLRKEYDRITIYENLYSKSKE